jgi:hypothetical protein
MRRLLVGAALAVAGCRQDAGLAPEAEGRAMRGTAAQCLAPAVGGAASDPGYVRSRLTAVLAGRSEVVCLSQEGGRWHLRVAE